jgi:hypothetical protein
MATSLVSTGVQFPDATIQTTAATGSPNLATNGSTIMMNQINNLYAYGSGAGSLYGSANISTTAPALIVENPEINNNLWTSPGGYFINYIESGYNWNATGNYGQCCRMQYDFYTNRFVMTLRLQQNGGSSFSSVNVYSTDGINWVPFEYSASYINSSLQVSAFNNYTGAKVSTYISSNNGWYTAPIRTFTAAYAYNADANTYTDYYPSIGGYSNNQPAFIDTGTQSTSQFFATAVNSGSSQMVICSRAGNNDAGSFSEYYMGNYNQTSRVIGMAAEIMCYSYNKGVLYSTNMGGSWNNYNFGNNVDGTAASQYWQQMAWNGSYWLGTNSNNYNRIQSKAMGSGTSWQVLTNMSSFAYTNRYVDGVAWNPTLGFWIISKGGLLYTNTSTDPNSGSWTLLRGVPFPSGPGPTGTTYSPMYVKATQTYNY